jgi:hypothetical protein
MDYMDWFAQNGIWILLAVAFVAMHLFGHGGHGRHGRHGLDQNTRRDSSPSQTERPSGSSPVTSVEASDPHHH